MANLYIDITTENNPSSSTENSVNNINNNFNNIVNTAIDIWSNQTKQQTFPECICSDLKHEDYSPLYAWFNYIIIIIMLPSLSAFGIVSNIFNVFIFSRKRFFFFLNLLLFNKFYNFY